ncbi:zf-TFIIB domain-containing protein [Lutibacter sp.]|uniref:TFIIB-type zinc ribbon-containing protein n=1 Tax=Lutibacter sp. TaxID=1925666 RepID=UPI0027349DB0|nr:zf-TFIIB domain-containing protein [Lutibacter sp.]MDP3313965.1 zf-TFIIB domain-containing protein [Lutibacter sp.]
MKCPNCANIDLVMAERQGIEIDYCPTCRGVWLDRGELDKIIEKATVTENKPNETFSQTSHSDRGYSNQGGYKKKPKHWLTELFD